MPTVNIIELPAPNVLPISFIYKVKTLLTNVAELWIIPTLLLIVVLRKFMTVLEGKVILKLSA